MKKGTVAVAAAAAVVVVTAAILVGRTMMPSDRTSAKPPDPSASASSSSAPEGEGAPEEALADDEGGGDSPERDKFGEEMARAAKQAHPTMTVRFDDDRFTLEWEEADLRGEYFLDRSYREWAKLRESDRAAYVRKRAGAITGPVIPSTLAEAEPKLVPVVRERISHEIGRILASPKPLAELLPEPPHVALTDHLWGVLAYETEDQFARIDSKMLAKWNTTFEQLWPAALQRLAQRSTRSSTRTKNGVRELRFGDGNESARLLVPSVFAKLNLGGEPVLAMPKEDLLLVTSTTDTEGLRALAARLVDEWDRGSPNMRVVRLTNGNIEPFVPEPTHAAFAALDDLRKVADQRDSKLQGEALKKRLGETDDVPFVATLLRTKNPTTGDELAFVVHTEHTPSLLPRADYVVFRRVNLENRTATTLACGAWDRVHLLMKDRWKALPLYPPRWLATDVPSAKELAQLGCDHPVLRLDLGVARPVQ